MNTTAEIGFYGKLPMRGDFVSRHLPAEFINLWDRWLQAGLSISQEQLAAIWLDHYLTSPIWRFVLSPGLCGGNAWAGIMMPSVDNVGRYFPFTVAVPFASLPDLATLFTQGDNWFQQLESAALKGLEGGMDVSAFEQLMQNIPPFSVPLVKNYLLSTEETFRGLKDYVSRCDGGYSLWMTSDGEESSDRKLLAYNKLPPARSFSGFLFGNPMSVAMYSGALFFSQAANPVISQSTLQNHWQSWAVTDIGRRRKQNEDAILNKPESGLWVVADGMGGHAAGDVASQLVVNSLAKITPAADLELTLNAVKNCLQEVNTQLRTLAKQTSDYHVIGSTVVALLACQKRAAFIWAGDSRLYRLRNRQLLQLTQDHCPPDENGSVTFHKNEITHAVGGWDMLEFDYSYSDLCGGDLFLLCSDGLYKELSQQEIEQIMLTEEPENIVQTLLALALQREGRDNISIVVVAIAD